MTDRPDTAATGPNARPQRTVEEHQAITVDILEPLTGPIPFVEYDPEWPILFATEEARIRRPPRRRVDTAGGGP